MRRHRIEVGPLSAHRRLVPPIPDAGPEATVLEFEGMTNEELEMEMRAAFARTQALRNALMERRRKDVDHV